MSEVKDDGWKPIKVGYFIDLGHDDDGNPRFGKVVEITKPDPARIDASLAQEKVALLKMGMARCVVLDEDGEETGEHLGTPVQLEKPDGPSYEQGN